MWEQAMSTTKVKRSWSILSRSSFTQAPTSPAYDSEPTTSAQMTTSTAQQKESPPSADIALLQNMRKLLSEFDQLCVINRTPLSDARVINMRKEIEKAMPRLYAMIEEHGSNHVCAQARYVKSIAEDCLRKFPEVDVEALRSSVVSEGNTKGLSSPKAAAQPAVHPKPTGTSLPPTPSYEPSSTSASKPPRSSPETALDKDSRLAPPHLRDAITMITPAQKLVLLAVHDLLSSTAGVVKNVSQAWFNPPAAKSLDELQPLHAVNCDRRPFMHTAHPVQHIPPSLPPNLPTMHGMRRYPPVTTYEHSTGTRSLRRSSSNDSML